MPKDYFSLERTTSITNLSPHARIHVIGVSGVAMAQLAVALSKRGYRVSGSDKDFYEPMGSFLRSSKIKIFEGYRAENVEDDVELAVIGNAISYGHPEVDVVEKRKIPYTLFPRALYEALIKGRHSIVACGTHGKTTTTALIASCLAKLDADPSYFVGGISLDLPESLHIGGERFSVVEGDEYDSAFFAKVPKFDFYRPDTCIINAVEYDHADIYPDLASVNRVFTLLVESLGKDATLLCCPDGDNMEKLVAAWRRSAKCKIVTFGERPDVDYRIVARTQNGREQTISVECREGAPFSFTIPMVGVFNARNALVTLLALSIGDFNGGFKRDDIFKALATYKAVRRRQEVRFESPRAVLVEDFAHHPTAVAETVKAIKESYPTRRLWAVFEPRSNTSRKKVFQDDYIRAFGSADRVVLCQVGVRQNEDSSDLLDVQTLSDKISATGKSSCALPDAGAIAQFLLKEQGGNDLFLVMSNGSFGGLIQLLEDGLRKSA